MDRKCGREREGMSCSKELQGGIKPGDAAVGAQPLYMGQPLHQLSYQDSPVSLKLKFLALVDVMCLCGVVSCFLSCFNHRQNIEKWTEPPWHHSLVSPLLLWSFRFGNIADTILVLGIGSDLPYLNEWVNLDTICMQPVASAVIRLATPLIIPNLI